MKIAILVYLIIGILLTIVGPVAKRINAEIQKMKDASIINIILEKKPVPEWKIFLLRLTLKVLIIILYPIFYLAIGIDIFSSDSLKDPVKNNENEVLLYYWRMGGSGKIKCNTCKFEEEIVSFLHGHGSDSWDSTGFQCQKCGKFHHIENDMNNSKGKICDCNGILGKESPLFCPKCKTNDISYHMEYIT